MKQKHKTLLVWIILVLAFLAIYNLLLRKDALGPDYDAFVEDVNRGGVSSVRLEPDSESAERVVLRVQHDNGRSYQTRPMALTAAMDAVETAHLPYSLQTAGRIDTTFWLSLVPALLIGFFVFWLVRSLRNLSGSKSPGIIDMVQARIATQPAPAIGRTVPDAEPVRRFLDAVQGFKEGRDGPRKLLLVGPPGSGKTTLVRQAVAASGLSWLPLPGSDVANVFVGIAAARVRRAFEVAGASTPCVLLIEDLDAMGARRSLPGDGQAADEGRLTEQVQGMIELCSILDGVREFPKGVLFVATTNRADRLDEALVRPGRIDLRIELPAAAETAPDTSG